MSNSETAVECDPDIDRRPLADIEHEKNSAFYDGLLHETRQGFLTSCCNALRCYLRAGSNGHGTANYRAALILYFGSHDVQQDFCRALRLFQLYVDGQNYDNQARSNESNAYYYMARIYYHGLGVDRDLEKAFQLFKISADQGQAKAQCQLGNMYCTGEIMPQNDNLAFALFEKAANQDDSIAQNNLGVFYIEGRVSPPNRDKALYWFKRAARKKNPFIQLNIAEMFRQGLEGDKDYVSALYWMELSGSQRCSKAQLEVGLCHLYGRGTEQNSGQAVIWLTKAVNNDGNPAALYTLGLMHMQGLGIRKNSAVAFGYFMESAAQNYSEGQTQLGLYYLANKNFIKAREYFEKAALNDNNPAAQYHLGCLYSSGQGVKINHELAFHWFLKSAFQNFPDAQNSVGECYVKGVGTTRNYENSLFWFKESISVNENATGLYNLGLMYYYGRGVEVDYNYAFYNCFIKSAEKKHSDAENQVGHCYRFGHGTPQDFVRAMHWYRISLKNNKNAFAQCSIGDMHLNGLGVNKDASLALSFFVKSAKQGCSFGQYMLGKCHEEGYGTPQNYEKAMSCYLAADENDENAQAQFGIGRLYSRGYGVAQCQDLSKFWFKRAADQGFVEAQQELANPTTHKNTNSEKSANLNEKKPSSVLKILHRDETSIKPLPLSVNDEPLNPEGGILDFAHLTVNSPRQAEPDKFFHLPVTSVYTTSAFPEINETSPSVFHIENMFLNLSAGNTKISRHLGRSRSL
ncbi:hypothetical protein INT47_012183 [Mucor saturninus]|uniref:Uncharacterized protein n=1 Tax=Mucor saturninus TaxID=64648 RepID=A0A8H7V169_9FUNG|nr:hypothetical protein INT47_012183 [Mucor saturninus]